MNRLSVLALVVLPCFVQAADLVGTTPEQFIGRWNERLADCGSGPAGSEFVINRSSIEFFDSHGPLKAIVANGWEEIAVIAEVSGEGQTWLTTGQFKLSPGGDRLVHSTFPGRNGLVHYRCPTPGSRHP